MREDESGLEWRTPAPHWTAGEAAAAARSLFGLDAEELRPLTSERDQNYRLRTKDGAEYIFKIANAAEDAAAIDLQNAALDHLAAAAPDLRTPRVIRALGGASWERVQGLIVRVLTWAPGTVMSQAKRTRAMRESLGRLHARLAAALALFEHPAADRRLLWDVSRAGELRPLLAHIQDGDKRRIAEAGLNRFERIRPALKLLRARVIHNDVNLHNVIVEKGLAASVIDFGDMVRAPLVCDVAVAAAYHVDPSVGDGLDGVREYAAAFHAASPLAADERAILLDLIVARMTMTTLITNWRAALYPDNGAYILRNAPTAWAGLAALVDKTEPLEIAG